MAVVLGEGVLTWHRHERVSDRYGTVYLLADGGTSLAEGKWPSQIDMKAVHEAGGRRGALVAVVLDPRQSSHIGDLFHGIRPSTPPLGEEIRLGEGAFVSTDAPDGGLAVGLAPDDGRDDWWLDPHQLYRAHEQLVRLEFRPLPAEDA